MNIFSKLAAIVIGMPLVILAIYAWPFPFLRAIPLYGSVIGVLGSAGLGFYFIKQSNGLVSAVAGALIIAPLVLFLSWFLIANIIGE
jgi:hypothetical protein